MLDCRHIQYGYNKYIHCMKTVALTIYVYIETRQHNSVTNSKVMMPNKYIHILLRELRKITSVKLYVDFSLCRPLVLQREQLKVQFYLNSLLILKTSTISSICFSKKILLPNLIFKFLTCLFRFYC